MALPRFDPQWQQNFFSCENKKDRTELMKWLEDQNGDKSVIFNYFQGR